LQKKEEEEKMALNGLDVSGWQPDINTAAVIADFVIAKATEGTWYVSPVCDNQIQGCIASKKQWGFYHYANGGDPVAEANYFYENTKKYFGSGVPCLDWESQGNARWNDNAAEWVTAFVNRIHELTGVWCMVYVQASALSQLEGQIGNCGMWVAQYPNNDPTGYQDQPWNEGAYACAIRQYTSVGRIDGYGGNLDLDKFYGDDAAWCKYIVGDNTVDTPLPSPVPTPEPVPTPDNLSDDDVLTLAYRLMRNEFGSGADREAALGSRYDEVQGFIDHIYNTDVNTLAQETIAGRYGNGDVRKTVLGDMYQEVQDVINGNGPTPLKSVDEVAQEVIAGQWGCDPDRRNSLIAAGYDADAVQAKVNALLGTSYDTSINVGDIVTVTTNQDADGSWCDDWVLNATFAVDAISGDRARLTHDGGVTGWWKLSDLKRD
jgi:GH25 family lysozyme M1 (1,4-beta-N-acetylmuramidase)